MDSQRLRGFFLGEISAATLATEIASEVEAFRTARMKKGSSCHIYGNNEDFEYSVSKKDVRNLCERYLDGDLSEWHLEYLCNLIELSDSFSVEDEELVDVIFLLSSPEINYPITPELVSDICKNL